MFQKVPYLYYLTDLIHKIMVKDTFSCVFFLFLQGKIENDEKATIPDDVGGVDGFL